MRHLIPSIEEENRVNFVLEKLSERHFFEALYFPESRYDDVEVDKWIDENIDYLQSYKLTVCTGATKACIVDELNPFWVIKIGFNRSHNTYFKDRDLVIDFCEREVENYRKAEEKNLQQYFAATYLFSIIDGMYVTIQEAVEVDYGVFSDMFFDSVRSYYSKDDFNSEEEYNVAVWESAEDLDNDERIYAIFGNKDESNKDIDKLVDFIEDNDINDLHSGNWGIAKDGAYVIMDFSGFVD